MSRQIDRHLRTVLDEMTDGMLIEHGESVAYLNPAYARMLGYPSVSELAGGSIREIADPEDLDRLRWFGLCRTTGKPAPSRYTFNARARGGRTVTFDASVSTIRVGGDILITTVVREMAKVRSVPPPLTLPGAAELSPRELEIVQFVLRGKRSKEIALELDLSEKTVFTHRSRAYRKLSLRSDRELFRLAADLQLI